MSDEDVQNTANQLLQSLDNEDNQKEVQEVQENDPMSLLQVDILKFFRTHIQRIRRQEDLRNGVQNRLQEMVDNGDLTFDQLMKVFNTVSNQENTASDSIISLFRPVPGVGSLLANSVSQGNSGQDEEQSMYDSLSSEQQRTIDVFFRKLQQETKED